MALPLGDRAVRSAAASMLPLQALEDVMTVVRSAPSATRSDRHRLLALAVQHAGAGHLPDRAGSCIIAMLDRDWHHKCGSM